MRDYYTGWMLYWVEWKCPGFLVLSFSHCVKSKDLSHWSTDTFKFIFFKVSMTLKAKIKYWLVKGD